jgi:protein gp37
MAISTKIQWCDHTFNPWMGCAKVSPLCDHCYAETLVGTRFGWAEWGAPGKGNGTRTRTSASNWKQPVSWHRKAMASQTRPFVFCASLADVFDNQVDPAWRADLFALIRRTPDLVYLLLTKRPQNIEKMAKAAGGLPANVALGASAGLQVEVERNGAILTDLKRKLSPLFVFLSVEPLLEAVDMTRLPTFGDIDWVIVGGESGHGARPMDLAWARTVRDQCRAAGVIFNFKQTGAKIGHGQETLDGVSYSDRPVI